MSYLDRKAEADADLAPLCHALKRFEDKQNDLGNFGACDSEPDWVWHAIVRDAATGKPYPKTETARDWELFEGMTGVGAAARRLTQCAQRVHASIAKWRDDAPARQWRKMRSFLEDYACRVAWD